MAYTKKSAERLRDIRNDWFHVAGGVADNAVPDKLDKTKHVEPFWQFRVAIKPTRENAIKAAEALGKLEQFSKDPHPEFKVYIPDENNQLDGWDGTIKGADRDQRGKEICVYMEHEPGKNPGYYENGYPSAEYLKKLMLDMWEALEKAGVEMAYIAPGPGEKAILVDDGTLTPFSYSSNKPWKGRHGILHSEEYNPHNFQDPLQNVRFIAADLEEHSITPLKADARIKQLVYQRLHYTKGMTRANADLHTPFEKDEIYSSVVKQLTQLVNGKKTLTNEEIKNFINLLQEPNKSRTHEPFHALGACGSEIFTKVRRDLSQRPQDAKQILSSLLERINTERVMAVNEMLDILPASSNISKARLEEKFDSNPAAFHRLYQRYALLAQENKTNETFIKKTFPTSYQKLDQEDSLSAARNLLNDYTKNNSAGGRAFTFHWFRHHTDEVNQIVEKIDKGKIMSVDELIKELREIKLTNSKGSLSRRIDFIVFQHVEAQAKMADLGDIQTNQADIIEDTDKQSFRI